MTAYKRAEGAEMAFNKYGYINAYVKQKYDRISLILPKGHKEILKQAAAAAGRSASEYVLMLIDAEAQRHTPSRSDAQKYELLQKWQVPRRYFDMIESVTVTTDERRQQAAAAGQRVACCEYRIILKEGYINDIAGRQIITTKTKEIRRIIPHTHAV